jgi:hypothetical protein
MAPPALNTTTSLEEATLSEHHSTVPAVAYYRWVKIGHDYLNLGNVVLVHFHRDQDGSLSATLETITGHTKHYQGTEAEELRAVLEQPSPWLPSAEGASTPVV